MDHRTDQTALHRVRESALSGSGVGPRDPVAASWRRVAARGLEPGSTPEVPPLPGPELERRRAASGLAEFVPRLTHTLASVMDSGQMVVVADAEGRVLWRAGSSGVRRAADDLGFVGGSAWTEGNVGTNAIGTCLVLDEGVHIQGPEHFVDAHTRWGCAAAPIKDPWSGRTLGVVDVSGPSRGMHPAELALVELAARMTSLEIAERHRAELDRLRAHAAPVLAGLAGAGGDALAVDRWGHLAAAIGSRSPDRVVLPEGLSGGPLWLPTLGAAVAEPLAGGWLLRLGEADDLAGGPGPDPATTLELDLTGEPVVRVGAPSGSWSRRLSPRHAELVLALVQAGPAGRTAAELALDLFADEAKVVTVRAELSRLRRALGSVLLSGPYRLSPGVAASLRLPGDRAAVLPGSSAPVVARLARQGTAPAQVR
ncbi:GAF domain-containing protein [Nocardioides scoriae]|uniref:GAF domain-containing protein n=1 Tax=Nocardioides scoriae TaxID=642780 RepID=A0A1H1NLF3_9ACTN|nr:GAF domain-containing protein [Nocardioides scoriae]SDR99545.1 GAF domain-containing protein [Nocardioides scoriae]